MWKRLWDQAVSFGRVVGTANAFYIAWTWRDAIYVAILFMLGTGMATGLTLLHDHGWGIYPVAGIVITAIMAGVFLLFAVARNVLLGRPVFVSSSPTVIRVDQRVPAPRQEVHRPQRGVQEPPAELGAQIARAILLCDAIQQIEEAQQRLLGSAPERKKTLKNPPKGRIGHMQAQMHIGVWGASVQLIERLGRDCYPDDDINMAAMPGLHDNLFKKVPGEEDMPDEATGYEFRKFHYLHENAVAVTGGLLAKMKPEYHNLRIAIGRNAPRGLLQPAS